MYEVPLSAPQAQLRSVVDAMAEGVLLVGADGRVARVNPAACRILRAGAGDLLGLPVPFPGWRSWAPDGSAFPPDEWPAVVTHRTGRALRRVLIGATRDGVAPERWVEVSSEPVGDDGPPFPVVVTFADVTERVLAERALRASEERFRSLVESMGEGLMVYSPEGRVEMANPAAARILRIPPEQLAGAASTDPAWPPVDRSGGLIDPDDTPVEVTRRTGRAVSGGLIGTGRAGEPRLWLEVNTAPIGPGPPFQVVATFSDVTARVEAERALRDSEARYRLLAEHSGDLVMRHQPDGTITYASPAAQAVTGWTAGDLLGRRAGDLVHPPDQAGAPEAVLAEGGARFRARDPRGRLRWIEITVNPVRDAAGEVAEVVSVARDVSARVAAEEALRESEERFRLLAEHASDAIARYDLDGKLLYVSPSVERVLGWTPDQLMSRDPRSMVHPDDLPTLAALREAHGRGEDTGPARLRLRRPDGSWTWVEVGFALVREDGVPSELVAVVRSADARAAAEQALAESEARFRLVAENASDVIFRVAADDRILWVSPSLERVTGYRPEDLVGRLPVELVHPDDAGRLLVHAGLPIQPGSVTMARFRNATGAWFWAEITYSPVHDPQGALLEVHATLRDVTARVEDEERERARARERQELMAVVSHELRAPLGALDGLLWLIGEESGELSPRGRQRLESARGRLSRLRRLASDLVVMTQLDAHAMRLNRADVDLAALVQDLVASARPEAERAGLDLDVDTRRTLVLADSDRVAQVVDNLLANAIKFSLPGGTVGIEVGGDLARGRIAVTDAGPGLPPAERERVFERFHRAPGAGTAPGSGLGLSIARAIVEAHGGLIRLEDAPVGRGLRAVVELPRE